MSTRSDLVCVGVLSAGAGAILAVATITAFQVNDLEQTRLKQVEHQQLEFQIKRTARSEVFDMMQAACDKDETTRLCLYFR